MSPVVKHLNFIQTLANLVVVAMENRRLAAQQLQQERDKRDLELAAQMQQMLVPAELPHTARMDAAAWYQPHRHIGGDYYDLLALGDDRFLACVADVSGKGVAAALLMSNFQATLRAQAAHTDDLEKLVHHLNDRVYESARGERFITLFIAVIDVAGGRIRFINAGHNDPLLHDGKRSTPLHDGSIALGMMPKLPFLRSGETALPTEGTLLCYTDGLVEQEDAQGQAFGTEPLEHALVQYSRASVQDLNAAVIAQFDTHRGSEAYLDDLALLTLRFKK